MATRYGYKFNVSNVLFGCICLAASFSLIHNVFEWQITGKWIGAVAVVSISAAIVSLFHTIKPGFRISPDVQVCSVIMTAANVIVAVFCLLQMTGMAALSGDPFRYVADFDNPAGVAAQFCVTFPFAILATHSINYRDVPVLIVFVIDMVVLFVVQSRAGLIALSTSAILWLLFKIKEKGSKRIWILSMAVLLVAVVCGVCILSFHKRASTSGRAVIINTCLRMVADNPLLGHGPHGFDREYMLYQAEYLKDCTDIDTLMLSDNVTHPLSEYMLVTVNYGVVGLAIIISLILYAFIRSLKRRGVFRIFLLMELCSICVISLFSYPFRYPMTIVALVCFVLILLKQTWRFQFLNNRVVWLAVLSVSIISIVYLTRWHSALVGWKCVYEKLNDDKKSAIEIRKDILPSIDKVLENNPRYQYSKAVVSYYAEDYESAIAEAKRSRDNLSSYDTELLLGSACQKLGMMDEAYMHYTMAANMCPSRIAPLYRLFWIFEEQNDTLKMVEFGNNILDRPVKVQSHDTRAMRLDVRRKMMKIN